MVDESRSLSTMVNEFTKHKYNFPPADFKKFQACTKILVPRPQIHKPEHKVVLKSGKLHKPEA
jgi:hypothetical protein